MEPKILKCEPIPDKKAVDKYGNPLRWILKVVDPPELRGLIAFPEGFTVSPGSQYVVEIVKRGKNYAVVRLHEHMWTIEKVDEDPYIKKIILRCKCGAWKVEHIQKFHLPFVERWKDRWYIRYALELRRHAEATIKSTQPPRYYYIAVKSADAAEKLFNAIKRSEEICELHESVIYDDEAGKWRRTEAWRGATDKSWVCTMHPPLGYTPVWGWVDKETFDAYRKAKAKAEELWRASDVILKQRIDIGRCMPSNNGCRRYVSTLSEFL
jgi:hypothetical protein